MLHVKIHENVRLAMAVAIGSSAEHGSSMRMTLGEELIEELDEADADA